MCIRDSGGRESAAFVVDPRSGRVLGQRGFDGELSGAVVAGRRMLFMLAPHAAIGQARLAIVDPDGSIRTVVLPGIAAGLTPARDEQDTARQASPGLAVDPDGTRAVVVSPETLLEIDLETLAILRLKHLADRATTRARKRIEGWGRHAVWLRGGAVAVVGRSYSTEGDRVISTTTGLALIDIATGTSRMLDATATGTTRAGDTLLAHGGTALRGYGLGGTLRFELLAGQDSGYVQTSGRYTYIGSENSTRFVVVDSVAGRMVGTARTPSPTIVLGP